MCCQVSNVDGRPAFDKFREGIAWAYWTYGPQRPLLGIHRVRRTCSHNESEAFFLEEAETAVRGSAGARGIDENCVEDWLQVVGRVRNGAQYLRDCRLLFNEFGYLPLQFRAGRNETPHDCSSRQVFLVHAQPFVGFRHHLNIRTRLCRENLHPY